MITGFNTDVEHGGRTFHVQTEERGRDNPVVETLVYCGGQIVTFKSSSYSDLLNTSNYSREEVLERMEDQHERLIRSLIAGGFEQAEGDGRSGDPSLDEVVSEYLDDSQMLLNHVQQFLDDQATEPEGGEESEPSPRARKLRRILERLEARMDQVPRPAPLEIEPPGGEVDERVPQPEAPASVPASPSATPSPVPVIDRPVAPRERQRIRLVLPRLAVAAIVGTLLILGAWFATALLSGRGKAVPVTVVDPSPAPLRQPVADPPLVVAAPAEPSVESPPRQAEEDTGPTELPEPTARTTRTAAPAPKPVPLPTVDDTPRRVSTPAAPPARVDPVVQEPATTELKSDPDPPAEPIVEPVAEPAAESVEPERAAAPDPGPEVWTGKLVDASELTLQPRPLVRGLPTYTRRARRQGDEGTVEIAVMIIENGKVAATELVEGIPGSDLNQATLDAAVGWEFTPPYKDTFAVRTWKNVRIRFGVSGRKTAVKVEE